jgi:hypothetical protein
MEHFQTLGILIENRWRAQNYNEQIFPEIAAQALAESELPSKVDPWDIIRWVHNSPTLPDQKDPEGNFGNPPITLFSGARFYIDVYYWLDGTTAIHQHSFTGAFQVLLGSSIHSHYSFREDRVISEQFSVGELSLEHVQLLKLGDVKMIKPGRQYIHSLFHLDRPSATITARTEFTPSAAPQYNYLKPYFATNPFYRNAAMGKKLQTVSLLLGMKHKDADSMISDLICSSDFHTAFAVLMQTTALKNSRMDDLFGLSTGKDRFDAIVEKARSVHGDLIDMMLAVIEEQERQQDIILRRASITGEEHRFFLALLLNVTSREKILDLVKERFKEADPVDKILDWVEELSTTRVLGSKEANALGIDGFDDRSLLVLEGLLKDSSLNEISRQIDSNGTNGSTSAFVQQRIEQLQSSPLFTAMLQS